MMDARKTLTLTMQEIKELSICLREKIAVVKQQKNQIGEENKIETLARIIRKMEQ